MNVGQKGRVGCFGEKQHNTLCFTWNTHAGPEVAQVARETAKRPSKTRATDPPAFARNGSRGGALFHVKQPCPSESIECAFRFHVKQVFRRKNGLEGRCICLFHVKQPCPSESVEYAFRFHVKREFRRKTRTRRAIYRSVSRV